MLCLLVSLQLANRVSINQTQAGVELVELSEPSTYLS